MAARTADEAAQALLGSLQRIVSCVAPAVLIGSGGRAVDVPRAVTLAPYGQPARLRGQHDLGFWMSHSFALINHDADGWKARTVGYRYHLLGKGEREIVAYHWHSGGAVEFPHLHVAGGIVPLDRKTHLPTGQVSLAALVRSAITEFGVRPRRPDWQAVLDAAAG